MIEIRLAQTATDPQLSAPNAIEIAGRVLRDEGAVTELSDDGMLLMFRRGWSLKGAWMTGLWNARLSATVEAPGSPVVLHIQASPLLHVAIGLFSLVLVLSQERARIGATMLICVVAANYALARRGLRRVLQRALRTQTRRT